MKAIAKQTDRWEGQADEEVDLATVQVPAAFPREWQTVLDELTQSSWSSQLGLRAARYTARIRLRTGDGPTFAELFNYLWPLHGGVPSPLPEELTGSQRREVREKFRSGVSAHLARSGWIHATAKTRSLRPGPRYRVPIVRVDNVPEPGGTCAE